MSLARAHALVAAFALVLAGCTTLAPAPLSLSMPPAPELAQSRTIGDIAVTATILTDAQARQHFGVDLGSHGLQAVWLSVRNGSTFRFWFLKGALEPDFYSADEAASVLGGDTQGKDFERLRQHLRDQSMRLMLPPGTISDGFVYVPRVEGGRYLDVRLMRDVYEADSAIARADLLPADAGTHASAQAPRELRFGFALRLPDGEFDYERLDTQRTYAGRELPDLDQEQLRAALEQLPCCTTDAEGARSGDPLNVVIVGDAPQMLVALSRSDWSFTHRISAKTIGREIGAAMSGEAYPVAPVSSLYAFGRSHDIALQRARHALAQRNHMRLWLAPFRHQGRQVWIGQVSRDIGIKLTSKSATLTTHVIDPQVDTTREYLLHALMANGYVARFGFVKGGAMSTPQEPMRNLSDDPYFSDGLRLVVVVAEEPIAPDEVRSLLWEQAAPPIAQGQSEAVLRTRPIGSEGQPPQ
jgi:LssY C-terminus